MKQFQFIAKRGGNFPVMGFAEASEGLDSFDRDSLSCLGVGHQLRILTGYWTRLPDLEPEAPTAETRPVPDVADERLERIATAALQGLLAGCEAATYPEPATVAAEALAYARALIAELDKPA